MKLINTQNDEAGMYLCIHAFNKSVKKSIVNFQCNLISSLKCLYLTFLFSRLSEKNDTDQRQTITVNLGAQLFETIVNNKVIAISDGNKRG